MMGFGYGYGMMNWGFAMVIPVIIIGVIIYAVVRFTQSRHDNYGGHNMKNDALDILNQRYASGEISEEEYEKKKKILRS